MQQLDRNEVSGEAEGADQVGGTKNKRVSDRRNLLAS